jgi:peptidoglycan hydrolase CwlO-like protein
MIPKKGLFKNAKESLQKVSVSIIAGLFLLGAGTANAASLQDRLNQAKNDLNYIRSQKISLSNEIAGYDLQIQALQLEIDQTNENITNLNNQINDTNQKILETQKELDYQRGILKEYLRKMYIDGNISLVELLAESDSFSDFVDKDEYVSTMHNKVNETATKINDLKKELDKKKALLDSDLKKASDLKNQLVIQQQAVNDQRAAKEQLLAETQGNEAAYQNMVSSLQSQYNAYISSLYRTASSGNYRSYGHVNRGDIIGYQGNSGYSTGSHLHFEVRNGNGDINPLPLIQNGTLSQPEPGAIITQYWGEIGRLAGYVRHTGIDFTAGYGAAIHAADGGEIIARVSGQGNTYPGAVSYGNYVMIRHANGLISIYAHLQ